MRKIKWVVVIAVVLLAGIIAGAIGMAYSYQRFVILDRTDEAAIQAAMTAMTLSSLRMGENQQAIESMESQMDCATLALASWQKAMPVGGSLTPTKLKWLVNVKMYRSVYPPSGEMAPAITAFLSQVPEPLQKPECNGSVCRLWEQGKQSRSSTTAPAVRP